MWQSTESSVVMSDLLFLTPTWISFSERGEVLTTHEQLTNLERSSMFDLAHVENIVNGHVMAPQLTIDNWYRFSGKVFRQWDISMGIKYNGNPILDDFLPAEHSVKVGTTTNGSGRVVYAYLTITSVTIELSMLNLSWNDYMGRVIAHKDIKFDCLMEECLNLAIFQYNQFVADRVKRYNERVIIAAARRRLINFSMQGTEYEICILPWDKEVPLKPVVFIATSSDQRANQTRNTAELLRIRP
jgi:hypothetical protein